MNLRLDENNNALGRISMTRMFLMTFLLYLFFSSSSRPGDSSATSDVEPPSLKERIENQIVDFDNRPRREAHVRSLNNDAVFVELFVTSSLQKESNDSSSSLNRRFWQRISMLDNAALQRDYYQNQTRLSLNTDYIWLRELTRKRFRSLLDTNQLELFSLVNRRIVPKCEQFFDLFDRDHCFTHDDFCTNNATSRFCFKIMPCKSCFFFFFFFLFLLFSLTHDECGFICQFGTQTTAMSASSSLRHRIVDRE
jgi:hypothetical protein